MYDMNLIEYMISFFIVKVDSKAAKHICKALADTCTMYDVLKTECIFSMSLKAIEICIYIIFPNNINK